MPPYPAFAQFEKPYSKVMQWGVKRMNAHRGMIVPVLPVTLVNRLAIQIIPFTEALLSIKSSVINGSVFGPFLK